MNKSERNREYRNKNREALRAEAKERIFCCECNKCISRSNMAEHRRTRIHLLNEKLNNIVKMQQTN